MDEEKLMARVGDEARQEEIQAIPVFCPECGNRARLIWSGGNEGKWYASWHCHCQAAEDNGWSGWWTADPEPFREKPQRFKTLFDF